MEIYYGGGGIIKRTGEPTKMSDNRVGNRVLHVTYEVSHERLIMSIAIAVQKCSPDIIYVKDEKY